MSRADQDARVALQAKQQIEYCERKQREREAMRGVDELTWEPEPTAEGLEDLL